MTLGDLTHAALMIPCLEGRDSASIIQELSRALRRSGHLPDLLPFYHAALNRELLVSTEMEGGIAFPHARLPGLRQLRFALGRCRPAVAWGRSTISSVRFVFLIAVPESESTRYLNLVAGLGRLARNPALLERLSDAEFPAGMVEALAEIPLRPAPPTRDGPATGDHPPRLTDEMAVDSP